MCARSSMIALLFLQIAFPAYSADVQRTEVLDLTINPQEVRTVSAKSGAIVDIGKIILGSPAPGTQSQIVIEPVKGRPGETQLPVEVRIHSIVGVGGPAPRLVINIRKLKVAKLEITQAEDRSQTWPIVDLSLRESVVAFTELSGGSYGTVTIKVGVVASPGPQNDGQEAAILITNASLGSLDIQGEAIEARTPLKLGVNAAINMLPAAIGGSTVKLLGVQLSEGARLNFRPNGYNKNAGPVRGCGESNEVLNVEFSRLTIGRKDQRYGPNRMLGSLETFFPGSMCLNLGLQDIDLYGNLKFDGGILTQLVIDNIDDHLGQDTLSLSFAGVERLHILGASLSNLALDTTSQAHIGDPTISRWGRLAVNGTISLPVTVYDALATNLVDTPHNPKVAGIRNFLVENRWRSFSSGEDIRRAGPRTLFSVLYSDAREIFGTALASVLLHTTGFGVRLWYPAICLLSLMMIPFVIAGLLSIIFRSRTSPGVYYAALINGDLTGLTGTLSPLRYVATLHRILIAIEIGLVTIFIQNAVLTGS